MTDTTLATPAPDASPTSPASTTGTVPATADQHDPADAADLDLLGDDDGGEDAGDDEPAAEAHAGEPVPVETGELEPWSPPDGQTVSEHMQPHLDALDAYALEHGWTGEQRDGIVDIYNGIVQAQQARLADADRAATKAATKAMGGRESAAPLIASAKAVMKTWPQDLRDAVRDARTSDGRRLALMPEFVRMLADMGQRQTTSSPKDRTATMQKELRDIDAHAQRYHHVYVQALAQHRQERKRSPHRDHAGAERRRAGKAVRRANQVRGAGAAGAPSDQSAHLRIFPLARHGRHGS